MYLYPRFQEMLSCIDIRLELFALGCFGADSPKEVYVFANVAYHSGFHAHAVRWVSPSSDDLVQKYLDPAGNIKITGGKGLKSSENYPVLFGAAVARTVLDNKDWVTAAAHTMREGLAPIEEDELLPLQDEDRWEDADLEPVLQALMRQVL